MCIVSPHQQLKSLVALSIKSNIDFVLTNLYDPTVEHSSFGRLNRLDCAIAIVNLFVDQRWEDECYHKVLELDEIYHFTDYENCPNIEIQICCNGVWKFHEDIIDYWFNL